MVQSHDELIMEIAVEIGLDRMGEDDDNDDDGGDAAVPPAAMPPPITTPPADAVPDATPTAATPELVVEEVEEDLEMLILEQEAREALEVILPDVEPERPQPCLFTVPMRDHEESPSRMYYDLDDPTLAEYDVDEWFHKNGSHDCD
jgi:hypothetical protein